MTTRPVSPPLQPLFEAREHLIVALDVYSGEQALALVDELQACCQWFKVGLELYLSAGHAIVKEIRRRGFSVFLDLKLHDIPNTVAAAVRSLCPLGADLLSVHASGGPAMLEAAAEAASIPGAPRLLAVTVLTSMDASQMSATGVAATPADQAVLLAKMAVSSGIPGLVCSAEEAAVMRSNLPHAILVTPGIRPFGGDRGDQRRIATPAAALSAGADYLVIGRPITQAQDPAAAATAILIEMARSADASHR